MKYVLFALEDKFTGFKAPQIAPNDQAPMRDFKLLCNTDPRANDYNLYKLGTYDTETAEIKTLRKPELLMKGVYNGTENSLG